MVKNEYSVELARCVKELFEENDIHYDFDEDYGIFMTKMGIDGPLDHINFFIETGNSKISFYGICPIKFDSDDARVMKEVYEFICRVNYGISLGNFEVDSDSGELRFTCIINCKNLIPSKEVLVDAILCTCMMYEHYTKGIMAIAALECPAKDAIEICEEDD